MRHRQPLLFIWHILFERFAYSQNIKDSLPVFQETENFTLQHKGEDCQESKNESKEDKTTKDKVNNNIQTAEEEIVVQGNRPDLSENLNLESNSSLLPTNEEQFQGNQILLYILFRPKNILVYSFF